MSFRELPVVASKRSPYVSLAKTRFIKTRGCSRDLQSLTIRSNTPAHSSEWGAIILFIVLATAQPGIRIGVDRTPRPIPHPRSVILYVVKRLFARRHFRGLNFRRCSLRRHVANFESSLRFVSSFCSVSRIGDGSSFKRYCNIGISSALPSCRSGCGAFIPDSFRGKSMSASLT